MIKIHIMHILHSFGIGGLENSLANLINGMDRYKFDHSICVLSDEMAGLAKIARDDVKTFKVRRKFKHDPTLIFRLVQLLKKERPDIVRTYNWGAVEGILAAKISGIKSTVHSEHGFDIGEIVKKKLRRVLARRVIFMYCDRIIVPSLSLRKWLIEDVKVAAERIVYIPNGCDTAVFCPGRMPQIRKGFGIKDSDIVLGTVGSLKKLKGQDVLLEAFSGIKETGLKLMIVGDGPDKERLASMAEKMGLSGKILLTGSVIKPADIYKSIDIFVLPSLSENSPNCLLEAMATGLPIVATDVGDVSCILDNGTAGVIVQPRDASALTAGIKSLLNNLSMAQEKGRLARKTVEERFSLNKMTSEYEQSYQQILSGKEQA